MNRMESGARSRGATPYRFGDVVVDPAAHTLSRAGVPQPVEPKAFAVLLALLRHPGELIGRDDLIDQVWGHRHVTPGVLTRAVAQLRHALGEDPQQPHYIQTRHALGYSFIGQLQDTVDPATAPPSDEAATPAAEPAPMAHAQHATEATEVRKPTAAAAEWVAGPMAHARPKPWRWPALAALLLLGMLGAWSMFERLGAPRERAAASVAVLPFANLGGNRNDDYFAEGLAEEMRDALAGVAGLKVVASVPSGPKGQAVDAKALGERLGVASILEASVRREGPRVRITARLTDTATGFTLWSHTYDRKLAGIFDTQSDIAGEVVHALLGAIPDGSDRLAKRLAPTRNAAAFDTYLEGLQLLRHAVKPEAADQAIAHFGKALKQDSQFARAQAGICRAEIWRFQSSHNPAAFDNAKAACDRAAQMDPSMPETDQALGDLYRAAGDHERALQHYRKSARSPALEAGAHVGMAKVYAEQGRKDLALAQFQRALELDPDNASVHAEVGYQQYLDGKVPQAVASYRRAVELQPDSADLWGTLGALYMEAGDDPAAESALEHAIGIAPDVVAVTNLGLLKYQHGEYAAAVTLQRQATALGPDDFMVWGNLGEALRADPASSATDMRKAFEEASVRAERYLKVEPKDARAVAALAFYRVILGDRTRARQLAARAEALHGQPGEVALLNAETLALLGDLDGARQRLAVARAAGIAETLIAGNYTFRRLGLLSPSSAAGKPDGPEPPAPHSSAGPSAGE